MRKIVRIFCTTFLSIVLVGSILLGGTYFVQKNRMQNMEEQKGNLDTNQITEVPRIEFPVAEGTLDREEEVEEDPIIKGEVSLLFAGDILFDHNYAVMAKALRQPNGILDSFSNDLLEIMEEADIFLVNNEFPYSDRGVPQEGKAFTFRAKPEYVEQLKEMHVDMVSLANNHAFDYGEDAFMDTLTILEEAGIPYLGAGRNIQEASEPYYLEKNGLKIAFLAATQIERMDNPNTRGATETMPGVFRCWNAEKLYEQIKLAKENSDFVVVFVHWGTENQTEVDWAQKDQVGKYVEAGADLVVGAHPHCLQPLEMIERTPVIYSVGNFLFSSFTLDTALVKVIVDENGIKEFQFIPCKQEGSKAYLLKDQEKKRVIDFMNSISNQVELDEEGYIVNKSVS